jgi:beta-glucosidase
MGHYLTQAPDEKRMRLLGFERVELAPGESKQITLTADPRLLARFEGKAKQWRFTEGAHQVALAKSAGDLVLIASTELKGRLFGK